MRAFYAVRLIFFIKKVQVVEKSIIFALFEWCILAAFECKEMNH